MASSNMTQCTGRKKKRIGNNENKDEKYIFVDYIKQHGKIIKQRKSKTILERYANISNKGSSLST